MSIVLKVHSRFGKNQYFFRSIFVSILIDFRSTLGSLQCAGLCALGSQGIHESQLVVNTVNVPLGFFSVAHKSKRFLAIER